MSRQFCSSQRPEHPDSDKTLPQPRRLSDSLHCPGGLNRCNTSVLSLIHSSGKKVSRCPNQDTECLPICQPAAIRRMNPRAVNRAGSRGTLGWSFNGVRNLQFVFVWILSAILMGYFVHSAFFPNLLRSGLTLFEQ